MASRCDTARNLWHYFLSRRLYASNLFFQVHPLHRTFAHVSNICRQYEHQAVYPTYPTLPSVFIAGLPLRSPVLQMGPQVNGGSGSRLEVGPARLAAVYPFDSVSSNEVEICQQAAEVGSGYKNGPKRRKQRRKFLPFDILVFAVFSLEIHDNESTSRMRGFLQCPISHPDCPDPAAPLAPCRFPTSSRSRSWLPYLRLCLLSSSHFRCALFNFLCAVT
uniref:HDC08027 n=1 Tax=Drosophila melanogaster TaxID=7227 RepID=Q6ILZ4_DROME|nr:TPA_inf: HDC08027 [Drosophila melanogaster]